MCSPQLFSVRVRNCSDVWWSWDLVGSTFGYSMIANSKARQNFGISKTVKFSVPWKLVNLACQAFKAVLEFSYNDVHRQEAVTKSGDQATWLRGLHRSFLFGSSARIWVTSGWWRAALQGECWKSGEDREGGEWKRPTSTKRQQKIQSNIKLSMFLYVSLAFWSYPSLIIWLSASFQDKIWSTGYRSFCAKSDWPCDEAFAFAHSGHSEGTLFGQAFWEAGCKGVLGCSGCKDDAGSDRHQARDRRLPVACLREYQLCAVPLPAVWFGNQRHVDFTVCIIFASFRMILHEAPWLFGLSMEVSVVTLGRAMSDMMSHMDQWWAVWSSKSHVSHVRWGRLRFFFSCLALSLWSQDQRKIAWSTQLTDAPEAPGSMNQC